MRRLVLVATLLLIVASPAPAQLALRRGDLIVSSYVQTTIPVFPTWLRVMAPDGSGQVTLQETSCCAYANGVAIDGGGRILMKKGQQILAFSPGGQPMGVLVQNAWGRTFAIDSAGRIITAGAIFNAAGQLVDTYTAAGMSHLATLDLAADQCTIVYAEFGRLRRFDICTKTVLPDFASVALHDLQEIVGIRLLPDGGLLAAAELDVIRFDRDGKIVRRYGENEGAGWRHVALHPDGTTFWAGRNNHLVHFELATGAVLRRIDLPSHEIVAGIAIADRHTPSAPTLSTVGMFLLAAAIAGIAVLRAR